VQRGRRGQGQKLVAKGAVRQYEMQVQGQGRGQKLGARGALLQYEVEVEAEAASDVDDALYQLHHNRSDWSQTYQFLEQTWKEFLRTHSFYEGPC
jgi:hypothetical protein